MQKDLRCLSVHLSLPNANQWNKLVSDELYIGLGYVLIHFRNPKACMFCIDEGKQPKWEEKMFLFLLVLC